MFSTSWTRFGHTTGTFRTEKYYYDFVWRSKKIKYFVWLKYFCKCSFCVHSVEKDGSPLSDERQTVQISLFSLLKDLLKSPTAEELHSVLAYAAIVQDEQQVTHTNFLCSKT